MQVRVLEEAGYKWAMLGLSLSFRQDPDRMDSVAMRLAHKGDGHNKYLEQMVVWLDIVGPRYWWQQFDTYRVGVSKQSESTMHTITKRPLTQEDFEHPIPKGWLDANYLALQRMVRQRRDHRLPEWWEFIVELVPQLKRPELVYEDWATLVAGLRFRLGVAAVNDVHIREEV